MRAYGWVMFGGALGALARYGLSALLAGTHGSFPWDVLAANVSGSFAIGLLMELTLLQTSRVTSASRWFWGSGFLGGYTTFSTFIFGSYRLLGTHQYELGVVYAASSLVAGLAAVWLGLSSVRLACSWRSPS